MKVKELGYKFSIKNMNFLLIMFFTE